MKKSFAIVGAVALVLPLVVLTGCPKKDEPGKAATDAANKAAAGANKAAEGANKAAEGAKEAVDAIKK